ncbi:Mitochondrial inner membrane protease atp23 [Zalerion maritima]|uniref:Mitochondrial inner membrane protease ATP23 n=1 Tax=Zalerion maritima TaxID=339359 RepID=A0AAD5WWF2_9PEZI|nr:Mitochondrial inner membrane protease atp23 [Zalerion maritima]
MASTPPHRNTLDAATSPTHSSGQFDESGSLASGSSSGQATSSTHADAISGLLSNDPKRTGFNPQTAWWINYFHILTGKVTPEGQFHYREWRYRVHEERDCKRCEEWRDYLFKYSPVVTFMRDKITALNGRLDESNVRCVRCPTRLTETGDVVRRGGGFSPFYGIEICANEIRNRGHLEDTIAHEMVHAYDLLRWKVDFVGEKSLKQAACTEIRASMLSGECRWTRNFFTYNNWNLTQQFQHCVRQRAVLSMRSRSRVKDDVHAVKLVNEVWDSCFRDTRPFDDIYR